jgi:hypothetical protein
VRAAGLRCFSFTLSLVPALFARAHCLLAAADSERKTPPLLLLKTRKLLPTRAVHYYEIQKIIAFHCCQNINLPRFLASSLLNFLYFFIRQSTFFTFRTKKQDQAKMSMGIARGRLVEERKSWRRDHPYGFYARPISKGGERALDSDCLFGWRH